jgi:RNA polymerase sigma factor (sigma-70 family)
MTDPAQLWESFRAGDREAYETLYRLYVNRLYDYARRFGAPEAMAYDCLHDLFVEMWVKRSQLGQAAQPEFYLIRALRNRLLRKMEQEKKTIHPENDAYAFEIVPPADISFMDAQQEDAQQEKLQNALLALTDRQREAIYLRFYQDLDYETIATTLQMEQQSAYNLVFRALQMLRKTLASAEMVWVILFCWTG